MTSPSSIGREVECLASVVLPNSKSTGPRAVRGKDLHAYQCQRAQAKDDAGRAVALAEVPAEWRDAAAAIDWDRMPPLDPTTGVPELALAWNPVTDEVRELGRNGDVEHDDLERLRRPGEYAGIIDWLSLTPDAVFLADWKFGYQALERAEVNGQLRSYGLLAAKLFKRDKAIVSFARIFDNGDVYWDVAEMDVMKLDSAESFVRQHLKKAEEARLAYRGLGVIPTPIEGDWCRYCPAQNSCPAKVALLLSVMAEDEKKAAVLATLPEPLTPESVAALWPKLKLAEKLVERLKENVKNYVRIYGAVKLKNGNVLGEAAGETTSLDPTFARPVLEGRFGAEGANMAIKTKETLTWKSLDELLKCHSSHGKKAKLEREVVAELEAAGAVRTVIIHNVTEVSPTSKRLKAANDEQHQLAEPKEQNHG